MNTHFVESWVVVWVSPRIDGTAGRAGGSQRKILLPLTYGVDTIACDGCIMTGRNDS